MWAKTRPWLIAALAGYGLCLSALFLFPLFGAPLLWLPWVLRRLSGHAEPSSEGFGELLGRSALALPACAFHVCTSVLGMLLALQLQPSRPQIVPFLVGTLAGPLVLPWLGAIAFMKLPLRVALKRSFDAWDARGLASWTIHGLATGAILSWPFLVFAISVEETLPNPLFVLFFASAGVLLVPAAVGLAVRYAVQETRVPPRRVIPTSAAALVAATAMLLPLVWLIVTTSTRVPTHHGFTHRTSLEILLIAFVPVAPVMALAVIASWNRAEARPLERRFATLRGNAEFAALALIARGELTLQLDDGSSLTLADGDTFCAGYFVAESLPSGTRVEVWVEPGSRAAPFRGATGVGEIVAIQPAMEGDMIAPVLRTPSSWLPWLHGAALVTAAWIWLLSQMFDSLWPALDGL